MEEGRAELNPVLHGNNAVKKLTLICEIVLEIADKKWESNIYLVKDSQSQEIQADW